MAERTDDAGFGGIRVIQSSEFGYGIDSVLLASFAAGETGANAIAAGSRVADLGTGSGIVAFILSHKVEGSLITGYEVQDAVCDRAVRALALNGLEGRVAFVNCDIKDIEGAADLDAVVSNPPYFRKKGAIASASEERYISRHESTAGIDDFILAAAGMLRTGGGLYLVHRPDRLADIMSGMRDHGIEPKFLQMVAPREGEAPNIVLICGIKGAGPELRVLPQIAVRGSDGSYTPDIQRAYERNG